MPEPILKFSANYLEKWADDRTAEIRKAAYDALSGGAVFLRDRGRESLRGGKLGLRPLSPLTVRLKNYSEGKGYKGVGAYPPLAKMWGAIIYRAQKSTLTAKVGVMTYSWPANILRKSLRGYSIQISPAFRKWLNKNGIVHLRKETNSLNVPARDVMGPIFDRFGNQALVKIKEYFEIKRAGGRF